MHLSSGLPSSAPESAERPSAWLRTPAAAAPCASLHARQAGRRSSTPATRRSAGTRGKDLRGGGGWGAVGASGWAEELHAFGRGVRGTG